MFHFPTDAAHSFFRNYTPYVSESKILATGEVGQVVKDEVYILLFVSVLHWRVLFIWYNQRDCYQVSPWSNISQKIPKWSARPTKSHYKTCHSRIFLKVVVLVTILRRRTWFTSQKRETKTQSHYTVQFIRFLLKRKKNIKTKSRCRTWYPVTA